jgi:predicted Ser/Thr protein kinase
LADQLPLLEVLELLGQGGMGAVYKARQRGLDRLVALQILPPRVALDARFAERFAREARALARLNHPHIVTVYDYGQVSGLYYVLMEYVDGVDLRRALKAGRLAPEQALLIVPQICEALQYAHDQGVVHRDIKSENILMDCNGRVKVADFGLAKMLGKGPAEATLTAPEQVMGTPHYMAPEQWETPRVVDHRADIYSLGVVFYEMLTGRLPLGRFEPPSRTIALDVRLDEIVLRALDREPERRYQQASHVKNDIEAAGCHLSSNPAHVSTALTDSGTPLLSGATPMLLVVAVSLVIGVLTMTAGIVLAFVAFLASPVGSGPFWGWMGAAFGCFFGGGGGVAGTWNTYRQLEGKTDLMSRPGWTWFDRLVAWYGLLGFVVSAVAAALSRWLSWASTYSLLLLGGMAALQAALFLGIRFLMRRAARHKASAGPDEDSELD